MRSRIGVLGGTFDPPHHGHLFLAQAAREHAALDHVLFVPAGSPPHKLDGSVSPVARRLEMVERAIAGNERFRLSLDDVSPGGPSFSWKLVERLHRQHPESDLFFIMGSDSLIDFPTWRRPDYILELATLIVIRRPGYELSREAMTAIPSLAARTELVDAPFCDLSSSAIRAHAASGASVRYLVPDSVASFIDDEEIFRPRREL